MKIGYRKRRLTRGADKGNSHSESSTTTGNDRFSTPRCVVIVVSLAVTIHLLAMSKVLYSYSFGMDDGYKISK